MFVLSKERFSQIIFFGQKGQGDQHSFYLILNILLYILIYFRTKNFWNFLKKISGQNFFFLKSVDLYTCLVDF